MALNVWEILLAALVAWAALRLELYLRNRRASARERERKPVVLPPAPTGVIRGSARLIRCACGHDAGDVIVYEGGAAVCMDCSRKGAVPVSCGHVAADGKSYADGSMRCHPCADAHDAFEGRRSKTERAYHVAAREEIERQRRRAS